MRYHCFFCGKSVTSELPADAVIRATLICPECLQRADQAKLELAFRGIDAAMKSAATEGTWSGRWVRRP